MSRLCIVCVWYHPASMIPWMSPIGSTIKIHGALEEGPLSPLRMDSQNQPLEERHRTTWRRNQGSTILCPLLNDTSMEYQTPHRM